MLSTLNRVASKSGTLVEILPKFYWKGSNTVMLNCYIYVFSNFFEAPPWHGLRVRAERDRIYNLKTIQYSGRCFPALYDYARLQFQFIISILSLRQN